ncbi:cell cycle control protein 50A-like [Oppia nitens]|uniref:cell cycle control protein 50A-like n=1 Tax=Oppia nitens TaxID=1686743 RepID=UPI0023D99A4E|nr:cell cycle control protein 50A-like [Oppia nitens]
MKTEYELKKSLSLRIRMKWWFRRQFRLFKQQHLSAWLPVLTKYTVLPTFFLISMFMIAVGVCLLYLTGTVQEWRLDYTHCSPVNSTSTCADQISGSQQQLPVLLQQQHQQQCQCWYRFVLRENFVSNVYVYYELSGYYQSLMKYILSKNTAQLAGSLAIPDKCDDSGGQYNMFMYEKVNNNKDMPVAPCGTIANSLFNDTFSLWRVSGDDSDNNNNGGQSGLQPVPLLYTGISWPTDRQKFHNPIGIPLKQAYANFTSPPYWRRQLWELDPNNQDNNGMQNEALIVWFHTAAFPQFRKLYARVDHNRETVYKSGLPAGDYVIKIDYNYPVTMFSGTKSIVIGNTSWMGNKNPFLGIAYIVVGGLTFVITILLFWIHIRYGYSKYERLTITSRTPYFSSIKEPRQIKWRRYFSWLIVWRKVNF